MQRLRTFIYMYEVISTKAQRYGQNKKWQSALGSVKGGFVHECGCTNVQTGARMLQYGVKMHKPILTLHQMLLGEVKHICHVNRDNN